MTKFPSKPKWVDPSVTRNRAYYYATNNTVIEPCTKKKFMFCWFCHFLPMKLMIIYYLLDSLIRSVSVPTESWKIDNPRVIMNLQYIIHSVSMATGNLTGTPFIFWRSSTSTVRGCYRKATSNCYTLVPTYSRFFAPQEDRVLVQNYNIGWSLKHRVIV